MAGPNRSGVRTVSKLVGKTAESQPIDITRRHGAVVIICHLTFTPIDFISTALLNYSIDILC